MTCVNFVYYLTELGEVKGETLLMKNENIATCPKAGCTSEYRFLSIRANKMT